ncbi:breast cancer metastasis-suppressor 1-like protein [Brevipalpus obovatus]|uniref:breast cancer metastasis-suppressor 1-like protein n=1 Tax=Brevipalpus obovatus TaxID=246614 RepID=UPI003D9DBBB9
MEDHSPDSMKDSDSDLSGSDYYEEVAGLDDEECDRLKAERIKEITDLEYQFSALKDQLYLEKINYLDRKLEEIRSGTAQEYIAPLDELVQNMEIRTQVAKVYRDKRIENVKCLHESEECAARQNLQSEKDLLKDQIRQDIEEKIRCLEEDRNLVDTDTWSEINCYPKKKRRLNDGLSSNEVRPSRDQLQLMDRRKKPVPVSGPFIVYMLNDKEILEDWTQIRKACRSSLSYCR